MSSYKALMEQHATLTEKRKAILQKAKIENRVWNADEKVEYEKIEAHQEQLRADAKLAQEFESAVLDCDEVDGDSQDSLAAGRESRVRDNASSEERAEAMRDWALSGVSAKRSKIPTNRIEVARKYGMDPFASEITLSRRGKAPRSLKEAYQHLNGETRAQSVATTTKGGYTVPDEMMAAIDVALLQYGGMYQVAKRITTSSGADLPIPQTNDTSNTGELVSENNPVTEQDVAFTQLVLQAYKYSSKMVRVSLELLQDSSVNVPQLLGELLGIRIARIANLHFTTGSGSSRPNGIVTAATDYGTALTTLSTFTWGELVNLKHSVDPAYQHTPGTGWMCRDSTMGLLKKLASSNELTSWLPNIRDGGHPLLDGDPVYINQDVEAAGAGKKLLVYGALDKYIIRETKDITLIRLDERYAEYGQVAFLCWYRADGDLSDAGTHPVKYLVDHA